MLDARTFDKGITNAIEDLLDGKLQDFKYNVIAVVFPSVFTV